MRKILAFIALLLVPLPLVAQVGGNEPVPGRSAQNGFTVIDLMNPISGVTSNRYRLRAFQVYSTTGCYLTLKIFRPGTRIIGQSRLTARTVVSIWN